MNRLQLTKRVKDLKRVIRNAKSYVGVQLADKQTQQEQIATLNTEIETLNTIIADLQAASSALVTERNTARMMYCEYDNSVHPKEWFAEQEGWLDLYGTPE
jgi:uncharacterized protein YlxW (UPF0749 family)